MFDKWYTGVGSRKAPKEICTLMRLLGYRFAELGWGLRSGDAEGPDIEFYLGAMEWANKQAAITHPVADIFLAWDGVRNRSRNDPSGHFTVASDYPNYHEAKAMAEALHPNWGACSRGAIAQHSRNPYQVLGRDLKSPSKSMVFWAPQTKNGSITGGTRTAFEIAKANNVRTINLIEPSNFANALALVGIGRQTLLNLAGVNHGH